MKIGTVERLRKNYRRQNRHFRRVANFSLA